MRSFVIFFVILICASSVPVSAFAQADHVFKGGDGGGKGAAGQNASGGTVNGSGGAAGQSGWGADASGERDFLLGSREGFVSGGAGGGATLFAASGGSNGDGDDGGGGGGYLIPAPRYGKLDILGGVGVGVGGGGGGAAAVSPGDVSVNTLRIEGGGDTGGGAALLGVTHKAGLGSSPAKLSAESITVHSDGSSAVGGAGLIADLLDTRRLTTTIGTSPGSIIDSKLRVEIGTLLVSENTLLTGNLVAVDVTGDGWDNNYVRFGGLDFAAGKTLTFQVEQPGANSNATAHYYFGAQDAVLDGTHAVLRDADMDTGILVRGGNRIVLGEETTLEMNNVLHFQLDAGDANIPALHIENTATGAKITGNLELGTVDWTGTLLPEHSLSLLEFENPAAGITIGTADAEFSFNAVMNPFLNLQFRSDASGVSLDFVQNFTRPLAMGFSTSPNERNVIASQWNRYEAGQGIVSGIFRQPGLEGVRAVFDSYTAPSVLPTAGMLDMERVLSRIAGGIPDFELIENGSVFLGQNPGSHREAWVQGFYGETDVKDDGNAHALNVKSGGILTGVHRTARSGRFGVLFGYSDPRYENSWTDLRTDQYAFALYGSRKLGCGIVMDGRLGYVRSDSDYTRRAPGTRYRGDFHGDMFFTSLDFLVPRSFQCGRGVFTPGFGFDYARNKGGGFDEHGGAYDPQVISGTDLEVFQAKIGIEASYRLGDRWDLTGGIRYAMVLSGDTCGTVQSRFAGQDAADRFTLYGTDFGRHRGHADIGLRRYLGSCRHRYLHGAYAYDGSENAESHTAMLGLVTNW